MATDFPLPAAEQMGFRPPSVPTQPFMIVRGAMGVAIPALLDFCCIADRVHRRHLTV